MRRLVRRGDKVSSRLTAEARHPAWRNYPLIGGVAFALAPWISLGFGTAVAFGTAAYLMRSRLLWLATGVYTVVWATCFFTAASAAGTTAEAIFIGGMFFNLIVGGIHAVIVSPRLAWALRDWTASPPPQVPTLTAVDQAAIAAEVAQDPALHEALAQRARRSLAREVVHRDPALAAELGIGRPDLSRRFDDGGLVDINRVPSDVLAALPGFDTATAERVVAARERYGRLESVAELVVHADVPPDVVDRVSDRLIFRDLGR
jgi:DNA uptake protein ComE-like DNA-binding protein